MTKFLSVFLRSLRRPVLFLGKLLESLAFFSARSPAVHVCKVLARSQSDVHEVAKWYFHFVTLSLWAVQHETEVVSAFSHPRCFPCKGVQVMESVLEAMQRMYALQTLLRQEKG